MKDTVEQGYLDELRNVVWPMARWVSGQSQFTGW